MFVCLCICSYKNMSIFLRFFLIVIDQRYKLRTFNSISLFSKRARSCPFTLFNEVFELNKCMINCGQHFLINNVFLVLNIYLCVVLGFHCTRKSTSNKKDMTFRLKKTTTTSVTIRSTMLK